MLWQNTNINIRYVLCRFMDQYGEMEEGALDADDIEGTLDQAGDRMQQLIR